MKRTTIILILLFSILLAFGQNVTQDTLNTEVKKEKRTSINYDWNSDDIYQGKPKAEVQTLNTEQSFSEEDTKETDDKKNIINRDAARLFLTAILIVVRAVAYY